MMDQPGGKRLRVTVLIATPPPIAIPPAPRPLMPPEPWPFPVGLPPPPPGAPTAEIVAAVTPTGTVKVCSLPVYENVHVTVKPD